MPLYVLLCGPIIRNKYLVSCILYRSISIFVYYWKSVYAGDLSVSGRLDPVSKTNNNTDTHCIDKIRDRTDVALNWYADMYLYRYRVREPVTDMYMYLPIQV